MSPVHPPHAAAGSGVTSAAAGGAGPPEAAGRGADVASSRTAALAPAARRAFGSLLPLLDDPRLRDLLVHVSRGVGRVWLDRGGLPEPQEERRLDPAEVRRIAVELVAAGGRHLDELHPCADVRLGDGIRVHAVLPPVAAGGAAVSIRVPRVSPPGLDELVRAGLCSAALAGELRGAVRARRNLLVTGGTGSGKTTVLAALLEHAHPHERIIVIEDVSELRLRHPHVVSLEARQASSEGVGEVGLDRLLRESLRMRPDRIVLGECRGAEISTLLGALNTGHDGSAGTLHANRLRDVPARLEAVGALAGLAPEALARQAVSALHGVIHLDRGDGPPRIAGLGRLALTPSGLLRIEAVGS
ncbi:CpaF family protein [Leucobacter massiliensis]|uniref:Pilus assembly protein CpaF n=1 Tax=Leucobacter massiliensis TaxID=1686285 RepID=A0A2S9QLN0_9MICO|nr:ATPase, T2SS/T4P/T4SS family [Leucobacter massiliensis]PRI10496.1 pilus assembly protein CpaF [Leucobacter massiliensis]